MFLSSLRLLMRGWSSFYAFSWSSVSSVINSRSCEASSS